MPREVSSRTEDRLEGFSDTAWALIEAHGEFYQADDGDTILELGQTDKHLLIILSGLATLVYFQDGRRQPTAVYRTPGEVLHHAGMHLQIVNPFAIEAARDETRFVLIKRETVYEMIGKDVSFAEYLFKDLSERFFVALGYLREQRQEPLIIRLGKRIMLITEHRSSIEFTQAELAEILAVTRISISKAIKSLEELGLVQRVDRALMTVDRDKLKAWLDDQD